MQIPLIQTDDVFAVNIMPPPLGSKELHVGILVLQSRQKKFLKLGDWLVQTPEELVGQRNPTAATEIKLALLD